ncbi:MAG: hypothetical protein NVSMB26_15400 [Beijerinckiaceae bacterium]
MAKPNDQGGSAPEESEGSENVLDHLGRQLRNTLSSDLEQPAYLGDPAIPPAFDETLQRLKKSVELREQGIEAVRATFESINLDDEEKP